MLKFYGKKLRNSCHPVTVKWLGNRLRENGTAVALVVYPLNIFFLATVGLLTVAVQEHSFYSLRFKYSASHDCGTTGGVLKVDI